MVTFSVVLTVPSGFVPPESVRTMPVTPDDPAASLIVVRPVPAPLNRVSLPTRSAPSEILPVPVTVNVPGES